MLLSVAFCAAPTELLLNGGFEEADGARPADWDLFTLPPQATATLSEVAHGGRQSALISIRDGYVKDPCNNWSQVLTGVGGKKLDVAGWIKAEDAGAAAVWVQFWKREPLCLLRAAMSSDSTPVTGTVDWTEVRLKVTAPPETDFAVVRCVLKGTGKAWFDDLSATVPEPEPKPVPVRDGPKEEPAPPQDKPPTKPAEPVVQKAEPTAVPPDIAKSIQETADLIRSYQKDNADLSKQVDALQEEIRRLKQTLEAEQKKVPTTIVLDRPTKPQPRGPVLVPHFVEQKKE